MKLKRFRIAALLGALTALALQMAPQKAPFNDFIDKDALRADLFFLAGDGFRGRLTDTPEKLLATEYIKARFERMGLKPADNGSFFQNYNLETSTLAAGENDRMQLHSGQDYYPQSVSASAHVRGAVVFAGVEISL